MRLNQRDYGRFKSIDLRQLLHELILDFLFIHFYSYIGGSESSNDSCRQLHARIQD